MARLFSDREIRAVAVFLPLAGLLIVALLLMRPKADPEAARQIEREFEQPVAPDSIVMRPFDPNTVTFEELRQLGLSKYEAVSLLKYRAGGKVFRIPEELTSATPSATRSTGGSNPGSESAANTPSLHANTAAGRIIADPLPAQPFRIDTVTARYLQAIGALTKRQAEWFIRWRDQNGIYDFEEFSACYLITDSLAEALRPYLIYPERKPHPIEQPIEINAADSATLRSVYGIGEKTVVTILNYRERLGGFVRVEQLAEVPGVTESNYEKILKQITATVAKFGKLIINFASQKTLGLHPYITAPMLRKILRQRQLKGGWSTAEELIEQNIMTRKEAARLAPYLEFGPRTAEQPTSRHAPWDRRIGDAAPRSHNLTKQRLKQQKN